MTQKKEGSLLLSLLTFDVVMINLMAHVWGTGWADASFNLVLLLLALQSRDTFRGLPRSAFAVCWLITAAYCALSFLAGYTGLRAGDPYEVLNVIVLVALTALLPLIRRTGA